ncbi:MAG: type II toxin-antitoxin system PemK/MazF family toxin [Candidatus Methylomirabilales bacterium]
MISRGEVYLVNLDPAHGCEQKGQRPVLVVSADAINRQPLVVTVVPGADAANVPRDYPTNVRVSASESGLPKDTVFLCFQIRALDPARFRDPRTGLLAAVGRLPPARMAEIDAALRAALSL